MLDKILKPVFGGIKVTTTPEDGATVLIDDVEMEQKSPYTFDKIKSGAHKVTVRKDLFQPKTMEVTVAVGVVLDATLELAANYGIVDVQTKPKANILIDGVEVGKGSYTGRVLTGLHSFETQLDFYNADKRDRMIELGDSIHLLLTPQPQLGDIDVECNPMEATVYLNGERKGVTPLRIKKILAGVYEIRLEKEGYNPSKNSVQVREGKPAEINETLSLKTDVKGSIVAEQKLAEDSKILLTTKNEKYTGTERHNKVRFLQFSFSDYTSLGFRYGSARGAGLYISGNKSSSSDYDAKLATAGLIFRFGRNVYMYTGAGYNSVSSQKLNKSNDGLAYEGGLILRLGPIAASAGLMMYSNLEQESEKAVQFGIGFCFGK